MNDGRSPLRFISKHRRQRHGAKSTAAPPEEITARQTAALRVRTMKWGIVVHELVDKGEFVQIENHAAGVGHSVLLSEGGQLGIFLRCRGTARGETICEFDLGSHVGSGLGFEPLGVDQLVMRSGLPADAVASMLLILELENRVESFPGGLYLRAPE